MQGYCDVFFVRIILKRTSTEAHVYKLRHQGAKCKHFDVSDVIYHKFLHGAASYTLNGENANVMLEYTIRHILAERQVLFYLNNNERNNKSNCPSQFVFRKVCF